MEFLGLKNAYFEQQVHQKNHYTGHLCVFGDILPDYKQFGLPATTLSFLEKKETHHTAWRISSVSVANCYQYDIKLDPWNTLKFALVSKEGYSKHTPTEKHLSELDQQMSEILHSKLSDHEKVATIL